MPRASRPIVYNQAMQEQDHLVVLFADISESTRLYETMGNDSARAVVARCLSVLSKVTEHYRGQVVKTLGDSVMCIFPNPTQACRAAGDMQSGIRDANAPEIELPFGRIRVKIGLHYGSLLIETGDVFGETVNIAARMAKLAKPDQIMTTEPTVWKLPESIRGSTRYVDEHKFEDRTDAVDLYEVLWEFSEITDISAEQPPTELRVSHTSLSIVSGTTGLVLNETRPHLTIGRSETNELIIPSPLASRQHARIFFARGRFVLRDQSVNGTFVERPDAQDVTILREEYALSGSGEIGLGQPPSEHSQLAIRFRCQ